jgi:TatD DNase family protein
VPFIDTHCHLDQILDRLGVASYPEFRSRSLPADFAACLTIACDPEAFEPTRLLLENDGVYGSFGVHPHDAEKYTPELETRLKEMLALPKTLACGEMGLDYHYDHSPRERQREVFARQVEIAVETKKPLVVHTREAEADTLAVMRGQVPRDWPVHVHCFTSSTALAESLLSDFPNLCIGFTGIITFKNAGDLRETVRRVPIERILVETDGPWLAPEPHRGKPAHPGHIPLILAKLAELKGVTTEEMTRATTGNASRVYGFPGVV